jgi:hypothetical protein
MQQILQPWTEDEARRFDVDVHWKPEKKIATETSTTSNSTKKLTRERSQKRLVKARTFEDPLKELFE